MVSRFDDTLLLCMIVCILNCTCHTSARSGLFGKVICRSTIAALKIARTQLLQLIAQNLVPVTQPLFNPHARVIKREFLHTKFLPNRFCVDLLESNLTAGWRARNYNLCFFLSLLSIHSTNNISVQISV